MEDLLAGLTPAQTEAVTHVDGPCLVIAGAGTGKTKVITQRIGHLILEKGIEPDRILALTFTDKAATEMEERVDRLLPYGMFGTGIGTFHSFCQGLVRRHAFVIGVDPNARLAGKAEEVSLLRANQTKLPLKHYKPASNPVSFLRQLASFMDRAKEERITPDMLREHGQARLQAATDDAEIEAAERTLELAGCYEVATKLYAQAGILTYADLIAHTLRILQESPLARREEQERIDYLLIDEFQDTNTAQAEICYLLAGEKANVFAVGDDDQAIYRFRGANIDNILQFRDRYPKSKLITLRDNFRSTQPILDASYRLITNNNPHRLEVKERIDKRLISHSEAPAIPVERLFFSASPYEQEGVVRRIEELLDEGYAPGDMAILARGHAHLDPFERELATRGIPVTRQKDGSFYERPAVEQSLAYLRFLVRPQDSYNLFFLLSEPPFSLDLGMLRELNLAARKVNDSLWERLGTAELAETFETVRIYLQEKLEAAFRRPTEALRDFITTSGWEKKLTEADDRDTFAALNVLYSEARSFEALHKPVVLPQYLAHVEELIASGEDIKVESELEQEREGVTLMTVHGSKGLEFPVAFVVNLVQDRFPGANRGGGLPIPEELLEPQVDKVKYEEERRLAYVAFTRAKERLILTHSQKYDGNKREKKPSPFLMEAFEGFAEIPYADQPLSTGLPAKHMVAAATPRFDLPTSYSASALEAFDQSPQQYLYDYVYRLPRPDSANASFGTYVHEVLNAALSAIRSGTVLSADEIAERYAGCWRSEGYETKEQEAEWREYGLAAIHTYLAELEEGFTPDRLEYPVELVLDTGIKVVGKIDRIDRLSDGSLRIVDYKTGRKAHTVNDVKKNLPLGLYAAALAQRREKVASVALHFVMTGEQVVLPVDEAFLAGNLERAKDIVARIEQAYRDNEWPAGTSYLNYR